MIKKKKNYKSRYNIQYITIIINLIQKLFEINITEINKNIIILTVYYLDFIFQKIIFNQFKQIQPEFFIDSIIIIKINSFQNSKKKIVIINWIANKKFEFLQIINQFNIGISYSQYILYIIGNIDEMEKNRIRKYK